MSTKKECIPSKVTIFVFKTLYSIRKKILLRYQKYVEENWSSKKVRRMILKCLKDKPKTRKEIHDFFTTTDLKYNYKEIQRAGKYSVFKQGQSAPSAIIYLELQRLVDKKVLIKGLDKKRGVEYRRF